MRIPTSKPFLIAELALFMLGMPLLLWLLLPPRAILPSLWLMALVCYLIARMATPSHARDGWNWRAVNVANLKPLLLRFAFCAALIYAAMAAYQPDQLFSFMLQRPKIWAMVMVFYPILSVIPQEIIYRRYIFQRFGETLTAPLLMIAVSGLGFGFGHIVFNNWVAPALCAVGGLIFAQTYQKTRSLALVNIEHALYGQLIFTLGLGRYFYHGAVH